MSVLSDNSMRAQGAYASTQGLAIDGRSLDALRTADPADRAAIRKVAEQFEALFMQQLLKSMREAVPKSGMFDGPGSEIYTSMLDGQLSTAATGKPGGLAAMIERQLLGNPGELGDSAGGRTFFSAEAPFSARIAPDAGHEDGTKDGRRPARAGQGEAQEARRLGPVQSAFVEQMWPHAKAAQRRTGIPAAWVVAQAALESGWGRHDIRDAAGNPSHNLFGIKAGASWSGKTVAALTTEYVDGVPRKSVELFRRYDSYADAFADWASLMAANPRYRKVMQAGSAAEFAQGLAQGGYATDPAYGQKLLRTIGALSASAGASS